VAIQIEVEEREAEAAVGERFEGFTDGGGQDGGVPAHAEKSEQMALHPCAAFDNQNTLIVHAVRPPGYERRGLAQTACHSESGDEADAYVTDLALKGIGRTPRTCAAIPNQVTPSGG